MFAWDGWETDEGQACGGASKSPSVTQRPLRRYTSRDLLDEEYCETSAMERMTMRRVAPPPPHLMDIEEEDGITRTSHGIRSVWELGRPFSPANGSYA